jgi:hypothetical protein
VRVFRPVVLREAAIKNTHRSHFHEGIRSSFADSLDIDEAFRQGREQEHRWDYLLGHQESRQVIGVEPHSAHTGEISTIISKLEAARRQLRDHLRDGVRVSKWLWVASGTVQLHPPEAARLRLGQSGIEFAGRQITSRHLR